MKVYKYLNKMCVEVVLVDDDNDMWIYSKTASKQLSEMSRAEKC